MKKIYPLNEPKFNAIALSALTLKMKCPSCGAISSQPCATDGLTGSELLHISRIRIAMPKHYIFINSNRQVDWYPK